MTLYWLNSIAESFINYDWLELVISRETDYRFTLGFLHKAQSRAMGNTAYT